MLNQLYQTNSYNWASEVQKYEQDKKTLPWGFNEKPKKVTEKEMRERDNVFNPILQVYKNKEHEDGVRHAEKKNLINELAKNKDNSLRIEQTFDLISLNNKLKGLEDKPNYPKSKVEKEKKNKERSNANYNLISCITLDKHNFIKPEDRPFVDHCPLERKVQTVAVNAFRDYDIISNKYKEDHNEKSKLELQLHRLNAAKLYNKKHVYHPIQAKFYDEQKEAEFTQQRDQHNKIWVRNPLKPQGEGDLYNPINMYVVNDQELKHADQKAYNKKKRFDLRYQVENFYRKKDFEMKDYKDKVTDGKISYQRFKEIDDRGFNIVNLDEKNLPDYKTTTKFNDSQSQWDHIISCASDNNTFKTKEIYRNPYDFSEVEDFTKKFNAERKSLLENLPKLNDDSAFKTCYALKRNKKNESNNNDSRSHSLSFSNTNYNPSVNFNKEKWFKNKTEEVYEEGKTEKVDYNQQKIISSKSNSKFKPIFVENKLNKIKVAVKE